MLSMLGAATGVCIPIGLSYLLLYLGFGYGEKRSICIDAPKAYHPQVLSKPSLSERLYRLRP